MTGEDGYRYDEHARRRMGQRVITEAEVEEAMRCRDGFVERRARTTTFRGTAWGRRLKVVWWNDSHVIHSAMDA